MTHTRRKPPLIRSLAPRCPFHGPRQEDARNQQAQKARGRELGTVSTMLKKLSDTTNQIARNLKLQGPLTGLRLKSDEALTWENS